MEKDEKKEKKKKKKKDRLWLFILTLITILANFFAIYEILLLGPVEEVIRYVIIGVFLLIDLVFFLKMKKKRKKKENKATKRWRSSWAGNPPWTRLPGRQACPAGR